MVARSRAYAAVGFCPVGAWKGAMKMPNRMRVIYNPRPAPACPLARVDRSAPLPGVSSPAPTGERQLLARCVDQPRHALKRKQVALRTAAGDDASRGLRDVDRKSV